MPSMRGVGVPARVPCASAAAAWLGDHYSQLPGQASAHFTAYGKANGVQRCPEPPRATGVALSEPSNCSLKMCWGAGGILAVKAAHVHVQMDHLANDG